MVSRNIPTSLLESISGLICTANASGFFEYLNPYWQEALGWSLEELRAKPFIEFIHHEDRESAILATTLLFGSSEALEPYSCRMITKSGYYLNLEWQWQSINHEIVAAVREVSSMSEKYKEQNLLSQIVRNASSGVVITDKNKQVMWVNGAFTEISGYSLPEVKGKTLGQFLQGKHTDEKAINEIKNSLEKGLPINIEILNYHKNGKPYWNNLIVSPIKNNGVIERFVGIQHDITERVEQANMMAKVQHMDSIGELAAGISHDFNNILAIIDGNRELLSLNVRDDQRAYLENIASAVERAKNLTKKILKTSKKSGIKSVNICIKDCMLELKKLTDQIVPKNISLTWEVETAPIVSIDVDDFEDAVINMIANAQNAINHHGQILIKTEICENFEKESIDYLFREPPIAEQYLKVSIKDTGSGIDHVMLAKIFEPFYTSRPNEQGTGLGLAMVAGFVTRQNLGLTVKSERGIGSEFTLWLPICEESVARTKGVEAAILNVPKCKRLVVMIDDEESITEIYGELLVNLGYNVECFSDPSEACAWLDKYIDKVDIIVSDEVMPGPIQGRDILEKYGDKLPVLIASGFIEGAHYFPDDFKYLKKPYTLSMLSDSIGELLNK
ncbi:PAS domain S-box protein [Thalassotalea sp. M1531]|uniref:histidine kinase n=1 Tax=Thalassotalea algicola TaxID=2716224 RepID=A0A7Y0LDH1_9GAMM|nr:PAS domain-containing sensor histidine kinase [Thalassotalea algicola]NMP32533.1 PAS domain S-box protein [Thalassotalea algicola]